jgi:uncharacterized membrane protein YbhN (UPF0104 family)
VSKRRAVQAFIPVAIGVLAVAAAVFVVVRDRDQLAESIRRLGWVAVLESLGLATLGVFVLVFLWRAVLKGLGAPAEFGAASRVFFLSQLGKYVPGSVWPVVAQMEFGRRRGISRRTMLAANVITLALSLTTALVIAAILLPLSSTAALHRFWWTFLLLPPLLASLHPRAIPALLDVLYRILRREPVAQRLSGRSVVIAVGWSAVSWLFLGLHLYVIIRAFGATGSDTLAAAIGGAAFAVAVGVAFIPAPAGAGVRDAALVLTLTPSIGATSALAAALASRVLLVVADLVLAAGAALVRTPAKADPTTPNAPTTTDSELPA